MTERSARNAPADVDRLSDAVDRLVQEIHEGSERTRIEFGGLQDAIDEFRSQLQWACNNFLPEFRLRSMAADPLDPQWTQRLNHPQLRLACSECECDSPASLEEALKAGWSEMMQDTTEDWDYLGLCSDCRKRQDDQVEATRRKVLPGEVRPMPMLDQAIDDPETLVYCCQKPRLEWNGDPDAPGVACESCGYTVAEMGQLVEPPSQRPSPPAGGPSVEEPTAATAESNFLWE